MNVPRTHTRVRHVGVAVSADRLVAFLSDGRMRFRGTEASELWTRPLTPSPNPDTWTNLAEVFGELRTILGGGTLHVALMPPLASFRQLDLTGVNETEAAGIVRRDPSRFLPGHGRTTVVELEGSGWRRLSPFRLIATPTAVLEALGAATRAGGWSLGAAVPAALAWAGSRGRRRSHDCVACLSTHIEVVRAENGVSTMLRRLPRPAGELTHQHVRALLTQRGIEVQPDATIMLSDEEAMAVAAEYAASAAGPAFLPERECTAVRRRRSRATWTRFVATASLLALTAALSLWDVARERASVAAQRIRIRSSVVEAMAVRESLSVLDERLAAIRSIESSAPHWSTWVATLAETLPLDAFLLSFSAEGDSLRLEGAASRAAPVFDALSNVPGVRSVRPEGPIRQDVRGGNATSEHFFLSALLDPREAPGRTP